MDNEKNIVNSEVVAIDSETKKIPERASKADHEIVFKAVVPPLNLAKYTFVCQNKSEHVEKVEKKKSDLLMMKNEYLQLNFDANGNLNEIVNLDLDKSSKVTQNLCFYNSFQGNNSEPQFEPSGAYIFRPISNKPDCLTVSKFTVYQGDQFNEIHQVYNDWLSQTIRLYKGEKNAEFNWQVGPIDVSNNDGKEVIMKFDSDLKSQTTFYTDSNGREILKRVKDFRPTWNLKQTEAVSGNYYPVNSRIFIRDEAAKTQMTLVTDRSQGGSSVNEGSMELMLHRITLNDDGLGVGEPLNEKGSDGKGLVVKGSVNLIFESIEKSAKVHRELAHEINSNPLVFFSTKNSNVAMPSNGLNKLKLPANLHLLTLQKDFDAEEKNVLLVRIEHFYEIGEDKEMSQPASICIRDLFKGVFNVVGVKELALGANMPVEGLNERLEWRAESNANPKFDKLDYLKLKNNLKPQMKDDPFSFSFKPMEIRTFHVWYA